METYHGILRIKIHRTESRGSFWDSKENHIKKSISAYSGHYRPTDNALNSFISYLKESGVKSDEVEFEENGVTSWEKSTTISNNKNSSVAWVGSGPEFFISLVDH
ncbi:hypothetical protein VNO78_18631 [Psophocarpus tetragonolobus]|uniref:Uncharacterized protein n=1 Tax=Psophocarpus tetragonolobus TaxID=3891 RepID=A0AAN9SKZ2_PSOTE